MSSAWWGKWIFVGGAEARVNTTVMCVDAGALADLRGVLGRANLWIHVTVTVNTNLACLEFIFRISKNKTFLK